MHIFHLDGEFLETHLDGLQSIRVCHRGGAKRRALAHRQTSYGVACGLSGVFRGAHDWLPHAVVEGDRLLRGEREAHLVQSHLEPVGGTFGVFDGACFSLRARVNGVAELGRQSQPEAEEVLGRLIGIRVVKIHAAFDSCSEFVKAFFLVPNDRYVAGFPVVSRLRIDHQSFELLFDLRPCYFGDVFIDCSGSVIKHEREPLDA